MAFPAVSPLLPLQGLFPELLLATLPQFCRMARTEGFDRPCGLSLISWKSVLLFSIPLSCGEFRPPCEGKLGRCRNALESALALSGPARDRHFRIFDKPPLSRLPPLSEWVHTLLQGVFQRYDPVDLPGTFFDCALVDYALSPNLGWPSLRLARRQSFLESATRGCTAPTLKS